MVLGNRRLFPGRLIFLFFCFWLINSLFALSGERKEKAEAFLISLISLRKQKLFFPSKLVLIHWVRHFLMEAHIAENREICFLWWTIWEYVYWWFSLFGFQNRQKEYCWLNENRSKRNFWTAPNLTTTRQQFLHLFRPLMITNVSLISNQWKLFPTIIIQTNLGCISTR